MKSTMLYRHFDKRRRLLYIGISEDALKRAEAHGHKSWGQFIARITVEHFPTRGEAEAAEKAAILAEAPIHNIVHSRQRQLPTEAAPRYFKPKVEVEMHLATYMVDLERSILMKALHLYSGNRTAAGRRLGLSLRQIRYRMDRLRIAIDESGAPFVKSPPKPRAPINLGAYIPGGR